MVKEPLTLAGLCASALACLFLVIALSTMGWLTGSGLEYGLFRFCTGSTCYILDPTDAETAVRFLVVVSFLLTVSGTAVTILFYLKYVINEQPNRQLPLVAGVEFLGGGFTAILGAIVFAAKVKHDVDQAFGSSDATDIGYSFGLDLVAGVLCLAAGAMLIIQRSRGASGFLDVNS